MGVRNVIKLINGLPVDINNIDIFEKAAEEFVIDRGIDNIIPEKKIELRQEDTDIMNICIEKYKCFRESIPFPLYGLNNDIYYVASGIYIKKMSGIPNKLWIDNGLHIIISEENNIVLSFVNNYWGLVNNAEIKEFNIELDEYTDNVGFKDIVWCLAKLLKGDSTADYYKQFMPRFIDACKNQPMIIKWELSNILTFGKVVDKMYMPIDKIIDIDKNLEYSLDIYTAGKRQTKQKVMSWDFTVEGSESTEYFKSIKVYGYELYAKNLDTSNVKPGDDKKQKKELYGINSLFCTLCNIKNAKEASDFESFYGIIKDNNLVYVINSRLFVAVANTYVEPSEIARGVELYSYDDRFIYFSKSQVITNGIKKEIIYSYNFKDKKVRLCKIQFVKI